MRFNPKDYDKAFPRPKRKKVKPVVDVEDSMTTTEDEVVDEVDEEVEENGNGADSKPDSE